MDYGGPGSKRLRDYKGLKNCVALMGGYGRETTKPEETAERLGHHMVAFHSVTHMAVKEDVKAQVKQILKDGNRPLFLHIFIGNWGINPEQYRDLAMELKQLGVEIVTPEVLADLYFQ